MIGTTRQLTGKTLHYTKLKTTVPWLMALLLLLLPAGDLGADPATSGSEASGPRKAGKQRKAKRARKRRKARKARKRSRKRTRKARRRRARKRRARRRRAVAGTRCRDIFCTSRVMALEGKGSSFKQLSSAQVERVMLRSMARLEPCLVRERRKNPHIRGATIEFVISRGGKVLASRLAARDRKELSRCMKKAMRLVRFPKVTGRTVATFTVNVPR